MNVEVTVLGSPSLISLMVYLHIATLNLNPNVSELRSCVKVEGGRSGFPVCNKPDGFCGRKAAFEEEEEDLTFSDSS